MAWTAPMTAVDNSTFTAAQYNAHVRDNLLETAPAKATSVNSYFIANGTNTIVERAMGSTVITTQQQLTGTGAWSDLATTGPAVTLTTGTTAIAWWSVWGQHATANQFASVSVAVSGATTIAADFPWALQFDGRAANNGVRRGVCHMFTGLTAGSNTFTLKYRNGTADFKDRELIVMAL